MKGRNRGFTLVELLIVIMIIGVLTTMTMLSYGVYIETAQAVEIVSNLAVLRTAAVGFYANQNRWPDLDSNDDKELLKTFLDRDLITPGGNYKDIVSTTSGDRVLIGLSFGTPVSTGVKGRLVNRAASSGVYGEGGAPFTAADTAAYMNLR